MSEIMPPFSDDPEENFRMENEFLKMKLAAQFGGNFGSMQGGNLPPEIENQFLKNVLNFESHVADNPVNMKKIGAILGNPHFTPSAELADSELEIALQNVMDVYHNNAVRVSFLAEYPDRIKYEFMTEELFNYETDSSYEIAGMTSNYIYEEFNPNHGYDIDEQANSFVQAWFNRDKDTSARLLASGIPVNPEKILTQEVVIEKMSQLFDSFDSFENCAHFFGQVSYDMEEQSGFGMAFAEGTMKYDGIMENGESIHFEGPLKIYFSYDGYYWEVMFFVLPGFEW